MGGRMLSLLSDVIMVALGIPLNNDSSLDPPKLN